MCEWSISVSGSPGRWPRCCSAIRGAEVIHVDPPGGPRWKTPANATFNRGKTSVALDLKRDQGRAHAWQLIDSADVVIENFRPGVMDRLGLGAREAMERNPRLISCSLPGSIMIPSGSKKYTLRVIPWSVMWSI